jgi:general secretion pathway protein B
MSLILDALRKSEHQRQREVGPGLAVVPEGKRSEGPPGWVLVLGGLLLLNILVLSALWLTDRPPAERAAAPAPQAETMPAETRPERVRSLPVALPDRPPRPEVRPLTTEVSSPAPAVPATQAAQTTAVPPAPSAATVVAQGSPQVTAPAQSSELATQDARLPRFADMLVRGELNVPHMHLDIHVYSGTPAERFVFINMRRYNEGEATQEGPRVERITRDGVIMDYQGQRFSLSRD